MKLDIGSRNQCLDLLRINYGYTGIVVNLIERIVGCIQLITFLCKPMGRREIFYNFSLLLEIEGHFTHEFVSYVYETEDWFCKVQYLLFVCF
jgi:hypothetical protein